MLHSILLNRNCVQSEVQTRITVLTEKQEIEMKQVKLENVLGSLEKELSHERLARMQDERMPPEQRRQR